MADAPDLGSGALKREGSSPLSRTIFILFEKRHGNQKNEIILEKEIIKNGRLIAKLKVQNQAELINKIKEIREYTQ